MGFFSRKPGLPGVTPAEVQQRLAAGEPLYILDVRDPHEWQEAHVAGATLIPLGGLAGRLAELPRDRPIITFCRSGNRSGVAANLLREAGFAQVQNLAGGIIAWVKSGLPVERGR